jgi:hypothetical protein
LAGHTLGSSLKTEKSAYSELQGGFFNIQHILGLPPVLIISGIFCRALWSTGAEVGATVSCTAVLEVCGTGWRLPEPLTKKPAAMLTITNTLITTMAICCLDIGFFFFANSALATGGVPGLRLLLELFFFRFFDTGTGVLHSCNLLTAGLYSGPSGLASTLFDPVF